MCPLYIGVKLGSFFWRVWGCQWITMEYMLLKKQGDVTHIAYKSKAAGTVRVHMYNPWYSAGKIRTRKHFFKHSFLMQGKKRRRRLGIKKLSHETILWKTKTEFQMMVLQENRCLLTASRSIMINIGKAWHTDRKTDRQCRSDP